jgi:hypothetical protein
MSKIMEKAYSSCLPALVHCAMAKPTRTAEQLHTLIKAEIDKIPELGDDLGGRQNTDVDTGGVVWREPVEGGANWTVMTGRNVDAYRTDIARVIRQTQAHYDLEE